MANTPLKIKTSLTTDVPPSLNIGEPAYSYNSNTLFIGTVTDDGAIPIGGWDSYIRGISSYLTANLAFDRANNTVNANTGGTITGDVTIQGNLSIIGGSIGANVPMVLIGDNIITLNTAISQTGQPTMNAGIEIDRGAQANVYLILFEDNKRKRKFKELCESSYSLKHVSDPTNINQYKSLSQLFDAVDPFIEREPSAVERTMNKFVDSGQALIPVKDRKFTLYIPKTTAASVIFSKFANWCTAREGNGMFNSYTQNNKKPNGKNSDIYIIINNKFNQRKLIPLIFTNIGERIIFFIFTYFNWIIPPIIKHSISWLSF